MFDLSSRKITFLTFSKCPTADSLPASSLQSFSLFVFHFYFLNFFSLSLSPCYYFKSLSSYYLYYLTYFLTMHNQKTETFAIQENTRYSFTQIYFFKSQLVNLLSFIQKYELLLTTQSSFQCLNLLLKVLSLLHLSLLCHCQYHT